MMARNISRETCYLFAKKKNCLSLLKFITSLMDHQEAWNKRGQRSGGEGKRLDSPPLKALRLVMVIKGLSLERRQY